MTRKSHISLTAAGRLTMGVRVGNSKGRLRALSKLEEAETTRYKIKK